MLLLYNIQIISANSQPTHWSGAFARVRLLLYPDFMASRIHLDSVDNAFRRWGYLQADIDPLKRLLPEAHPDLDEQQPQAARRWREIYCGKIGLEFMHISFPERCEWLAAAMEDRTPEVNAHFLLQRLMQAEIFENFLHARYVGLKRFSLEGNTAVIALLDAVIDQAGRHGFESVLIVMSHRGRLNVMEHIVKTPMEDIVATFEDLDPKSALGSDDVKYHKGATGYYASESGKQLRIHLMSNPSHLESGNAVLMGRVRAQQERLRDTENEKVLGIIMHGDAAFAGQGPAAEALNLADLPGYRIGGAIHVVVNNMIGFTALPSVFNSSRYATDVAKRLPIPIFHLNGDAPEAVVHAGRIAMDYRRTFKSDVVLDVIGYRRHGHSEVDDPTLTAPLLYEKIKAQPLLYKSYAAQLGVSDAELKAMEEQIAGALEEGLQKGRRITKKPALFQIPDYWASYTGGYYQQSFETDTAAGEHALAQVFKAICSLPHGFALHPKLGKFLEQKQEMAEGKRLVDWGTAEALAFGTLLLEQTPVRLSGQDSRRGTFNHRHAVLYDAANGGEYIPLTHIAPDQARFDVYDSMLSEAAVLGFEYGFSRDYPEALVCWEAQFGDFVNGAQVIIDQFISAAEDKWGLRSGLTLLLPHGFEGQGPEHSSARLERFLQLAAEDNMQVCQPSVASQYFHLLRRQALRKWRKPLIIMTPKSMLRAAAASSPLDDFRGQAFRPVLLDEERFHGAVRLLVCSGKISHELRLERTRRSDNDTAIITIEQLYPLPEEELRLAFNRYRSAKSIVWVQEEPANQGAKWYVKPHLERLSGGRKVLTVRRSESASPATGSAKAHELEQQAILKLAFAHYDH